LNLAQKQKAFGRICARSFTQRVTTLWVAMSCSKHFPNIFFAPVVKWISRLASDQAFRVRILTGAHADFRIQIFDFRFAGFENVFLEVDKSKIVNQKIVNRREGLGSSAG
jgi:hypothetical protein